MKNDNKLKISYEPDADIVRMSWGEIKSIDHAEENGDVILHVNRKDEPVLVEILNASTVFRRPVLSTLKSYPMFTRTRRTVLARRQKPVAA